MERSQPQAHQHARGRRGQSHSSSSSSSSSSSFTHSSSRFQHAHNSQSPNNLPKNVNPSTRKKNTSAAAAVSTTMDVRENPPTIVGTCPFMCPVEERTQREQLRDLAVFERLNGNTSKSSSSLAVKKFCRTITTNHLQASNLRPVHVLEHTLDHLFRLLDSKEHSFEVVYDFIFDRTRSIRQDLSMQNIIGDEAIHMYERMVKFHILSHHKLQRCSGSPDISSMIYLNMEQLTKALMSLYNLYEANRNSWSIYENEAEFHSFYVLLHLGSNGQPMAESLSLWFRKVRSSIIKSKEMCFARRILRYFRLGNYKRFICTTEAEASHLQYCIIEPYITEVRELGLCCVNYVGHKLYPYPLADLSKLLLMKELDVESFCHDSGLETSADATGKAFLPTKQTSFCHSKRSFPKYYLLESERLRRLSAECSGLLLLRP